jgi:protein-arginine deiminase
LKTFNDAAQSTIDTERAKLESAIGVTAADIIDVPIIYLPNDVSLAQADALTGGMVNMLVANKHCLIPKPFGPVVGGKDLFEEDLKTRLAPLGLTLDFIDNWFEYHVSLGEVHCGTNTLRAPTQAKWWEFIP